MDIVAAIHVWAAQKMNNRLLRRWGVTHQCPWCRQIVETDGKHRMREAEHCAFFDTFTCGVCGGESHWEFGPLPLPRGLGSPPIPEEWAADADKETQAILGDSHD